MPPLLLLLLLPLFTLSAIPSVAYTPAGTFSSSARSFTISSNKDVSTCNCDLIANSCDPDCCCDSDCAAVSGATCTTNLFQTEVTQVERCIGDTFLFSFTLRPGMRSYYDSATKRRCFQSDNSPIRSNFQQEITSTSKTMAELFASEITAFASTISQASQSPISLTYGAGSAIRVLINSNYYNFPFPQQDASGICPEDYSFAPTYLISAETKCTRTVALSASSCTGSSYGVQYWRDSLQILNAPSDASAGSITPTASYIKIAGSTSSALSSPPTSAFSGSTCNNGLRGFHLQLTYAQGSGLITAAHYDIVVEDLTSVPVDQSFKLSFKESSTATATDYSGRPGYQSGKPLLVGTASNGVVIRKSEGFQITGVDSSGNCATTAGLLADSKTLNFAEDTLVRCSRSFTSLANFASMCSSDQYKTMLLFTNLISSFQEVGIFGSAKGEYQGDWISVIGLDTLTSLTSSLSNDQTECTLIGGVEIKVLTSKAGPVTNGQNYIVGVEVSPVTETWTWYSSTQNPFSHWVTVRYAEIVPQNIESQRESKSASWLPALPGVRSKVTLRISLVSCARADEWLLLRSQKFIYFFKVPKMAAFSTFGLLGLLVCASALSMAPHKSHLNSFQNDSMGGSSFLLKQSASTPLWYDIAINEGYNIVYQFLDGFGFHSTVSSSQTCFDSTSSFASKIVISIEQFRLGNHFTGFFNGTESLKQAGNFTRHCYGTVEDSYTQATNYFAQFDSFSQYSTILQDQILSKFTTISISYAALKDALSNNNYALAAYHTGVAIKAVLTVDPPVKLLAPAPEFMKTPLLRTSIGGTQITTVDTYATKFMEFLFPFIYHSNTLVDSDRLNTCSDAVVGFNNKLGEISSQLSSAQLDRKEALFLFADSLSLIHPMSWECYGVVGDLLNNLSSNIIKDFDYEDTMLNAFLFNLHIKKSYYTIKASLTLEAGSDWARIGQELGDVVQILFSNA